MKIFKTKNSQKVNLKLRDVKGITLVALIITIIILLILAGIAISSLSNSGLFSKTQDAVQKSKQADLEEQVKLAVMASLDNSGNLVKTELITNLGKSLEKASGDFLANRM